MGGYLREPPLKMLLSPEPAFRLVVSGDLEPLGMAFLSFTVFLFEWIPHSLGC